jgi:hypothetical protein
MAEDSPKIEISFTKKELIELAYLLSQHKATLDAFHFNHKEEKEACEKYKNLFLDRSQWAVLDE